MLSKIKSLLGKSSLPEKLTPELEKKILSEGKPEQRAALASRPDARPEVLYFLADDSEPSVRKQIAANPSTPVMADEKLSHDQDAEVRSELARKIKRIIPGLEKGETSALSDKALAVIEQLAQDQLPRIRAVVAEELKATDAVPKAIIDKLARDIEDIVAVPIIEYSPLLNDDDLREIIAAGASSRRLQAVAKRPSVSEVVANDLAATLDIPAISALLTNENAQIREETLDQIITQAQGVDALHKPLALRPQLSIRAMKRIAGFVASALVHKMINNSDLEEELAEELLEKVRDRISSEKVGDSEEAALAKKAREFDRRGMLTDAFFCEQIDAGRRELIVQCLALKAELPSSVVRSVIMSKSGRAVTGLVWKAGLKMRTAYEMQNKLALVPKTQLLHGKDGNKYPIPEDELEWHLSYFTEQ